jgi:hypothetical protein
MRLKGTRAATKASPVIPVVKVVVNGRLEGTRAATKGLPELKVVDNGRLEGTGAATEAFSCHPSGEGCRKRKVGRDQGSH